MLDEFDIESYRLKPLNKGLGFHEKEQGRQSTRPSLKAGLEKRLERNDSLKAFYEMPPAGNKKVPVNVVEEDRETEEHVQFFGWLLDLLLVGVISSAFIVGLGLFAYFFGKTSVETVILTLSRIDGLAGMGVLFVITYLLYFTYGDIGTSFGKKFFGMKLVAKSGKSLTSKMTFIRSSATLLSLCLLGIPAWFDVQGQLSGTKVVRE